MHELSIAEVDQVDGGALSTTETVAYTIIGLAAVATGTAPLVIGGTFLLTMTGILATS